MAQPILPALSRYWVITALPCCWLSVPALAEAVPVPEFEFLDVPHACSGPAEECNALASHWAEAADAEAELLRVSMLQTVFSVGARPSLQGGREPNMPLHQVAKPDAPAQPGRQATIHAKGDVSEMPQLQGGGVAVAGNSKRAGSLRASATAMQLPDSAFSVEVGEAAEVTPSLYQTNLELSSPDVPSNVAASDAAMGPSQPTRLLATNATRKCDLGAECMAQGTPLELQIQLDWLRLAGLIPKHAPSLPDLETGQKPALALLQLGRLHPNFFGYLLSKSTSDEHLIVGLYGFFYIVSMLTMYYWVMRAPPQHKGVESAAKPCKQKFDIDVEEETWRQGCLGWLAVSWASPWVARWGHSVDASRTKVKPSELPQMGSRELQSREAAKHFEQLWQEEIRAVGEANASLTRVVMRVWTVKTMLYLMFCLVFQVLIGQIYSVFLIERAMNYFHWLQSYIAEHGEPPDVTMPLLISVAAFLALPFSNIFFTSINSSVACRLDQKLCGGLSVALFRKSQRLPAAAPLFTEANEGTEGSEPQFDLLNLVNYDVNTNLVGAYLMFCTCSTSFTAVIVLTVMLWTRLHWATLCAIGCAVPVILFSLFLMSGVANSFTTMQSSIDKRLTTLREVLYGIRVVKGYAWEAAMEDKIKKLRYEELKSLAKYFDYLGGILGIFFGFPRVLILSGLWGFAAIYGKHDVATIFTCMQILSSLRWSCDVFIKSFAAGISVYPSILRVEGFLKLSDAPLLPDTNPDWVKLWPEGVRSRESSHSALTDVDTPMAPSSSAPRLRLQGSYKWSEEGPLVLRDLSIDVPRGKLIGVVGAVGSGKSTLLQALLGELYPDTSKPACISRPGCVAYCSQVPHIAEGTLRENVLFGQPFDSERYADAIQSASLKPDLAVLPGGDEVPIGSRGITLSGGQKARVAMARAAYHMNSELVIIDDPFAAVDAPTAKVILEQLLLGPLMQHRTRVVSLQPDAQRLRNFDHLLIMEKGRVVDQGTPEEVMKAESYQRLLSTHSEVFEGSPTAASKPRADGSPKRAEQPQLEKLREEEVEGRPTWTMINEVCKLGLLRNLYTASVTFCLCIYLYLLCDLTLAHWTNAMVLDPHVRDSDYLLGYLFWLLSALGCWVFCWYGFGQRFTLGVSKAVHDMVLEKVLSAPIDRFFDKHPVGRIMNRLSTDMLVVDLQFYIKGTGGCTAVFQTMVPIIYVHTIMPWFISIAAIPFYCMMGVFCMRFWNTTVPLRYCMTGARSDVSSYISDVIGNKVVIRAYGDQERSTLDMSEAIDNQVKAGLGGDRVLRRWLVNRIVFMWSFYTTTMYMVGVLSAAHIGAGTLGICLTNLLLVESNIDAYLDTATGAQFEFIALARLYEYLSVPQEKPRVKPGDGRLTNFTVRVPRKSLGANLSFSDINGTVEVTRSGTPVLSDALGGTVLMPANAAGSAGANPRFVDVFPSCSELGRAESWHRIVAVNDHIRDAKAMARALCGDSGDASAGAEAASHAELTLEIHSGWLLEGAHVQIENLKAGYADIPRDVLKGISLTFEKRTKVAIAGTTGCGKSSLLLALLRILEPRSGRILLNGIDISSLGLATLRSAIGLVPQDPVLFSGSLRHNLDPFQVFTDGRSWQALRRVQLESLVAEWPGQLDYRISDEGANLSFGQRQLVCLARMILRQPGLLLLDEATSAIEPHTQQLVQDTIKSAFPLSTLVAVAHRLETVLDFDHVIVMEQGDVVEQGPVKELVERKDGRFRSMLTAKSSW